jgi:hypothetical protein
MWEIEYLSVQIEYGSVIVGFRRREVQSVARPYIESEPIGDLPVVSHKKFADVRAVQQRLILNVDAECVYLAKQKEANAFPPVAVDELVPVVVKA